MMVPVCTVVYAVTGYVIHIAKIAISCFWHSDEIEVLFS